MVVLFRTDCDAGQGMGHIMRCTALARAFAAAGHAVVFACGKPDSIAFARSVGIEVLDLTGLDSAGELKKMRRYSGEKMLGVMLADSYEFSPGYLGLMDGIAPTVFIDDLYTDGLDITAIVNGNITSDLARYRELYPAGRPALLIGTEYAMLREEFRGLGGFDTSRELRRILISSGGSDPYSASVVITESLLASPALADATISVMVGPLNNNIDNLRSLAYRERRVSVLEGVTDVAALMRSCDIAVAAAGGTLNELCACGVPSVAYALADNQLAAVDAFANASAALGVGAVWDEGFCERLTAAVEVLATDEKKRSELSANACDLFDGRGADRIVDELTGLLNLV